MQAIAEDECRPGPAAALTRSEVVTLALFGPGQPLASERDFYRDAQRHRPGAFPTWPDRPQCHRALRPPAAAGVNGFLHRVPRRQAQRCADEALAGTAAVTRDSKRRGLGWRPGVADIGWSHRWGWDEGFPVLLAVNPSGVSTGFGFGSASTKDQPLAETLFAVRACPDPRVASGRAPAQGPAVTAKGFEGQDRHQHWPAVYGAEVICAPQRNSRHPWPRPWRRWRARLRQMVATVNGRLQHIFRLERERPHALDGFQLRLTAKMALPNCCIWLNPHLGRPPLAFADLVAW